MAGHPGHQHVRRPLQHLDPFRRAGRRLGSADIPDIAGIYQGYAKARAPNAPALQWGYLPLTVAAAHAPKMPPLRAAFELRRLAFANRGANPFGPADLLIAAQLSLVEVLTQTRRAIAGEVAIRLAFETINGMAKTAPVLPKHMQAPAGQRAVS